jgi:toxin ParE1/3/4
VKLVHVLPAAGRDIRQAIDWLKQESRPAAQGFKDDLHQAGHLLATQPGIGSRRYAGLFPDGDLRMLPLSRFPYLIFYLERETSIDVLRVLHGARDLPPLLQTPTTHEH